MMRALAVAALVGVLTACQSEPIGGPLSIEVGAPTPVAILQTINEAGQRCWMKAGEKPFRKYRLVPELDTIAGNPRILLVERNNSAGRPQLVIESTSSPVKVSTFGPLVRTRLGGRINADIIRWSTGDPRCAGHS